MVLDKTAPDEVVGRFDARRALFMPLRFSATDPLGPGETVGYHGSDMPHYGTTTLNPEGIHRASPMLQLFLQLHAPGLRFARSVDDAGEPVGLIVHNANALAEVAFTPLPDGTWPVRQRGTQRLWDTIEAGARTWRPRPARPQPPGNHRPRRSRPPVRLARRPGRRLQLAPQAVHSWQTGTTPY